MSLGHVTDLEDGKVGIPDYLKRVDIACGNSKRTGFTGIDISKDTQADVIHDLNAYPWPLEDGSCFELFSSHFIEHVNDIKKFMEECYRILVPQGVLTVVAPYHTAIGAWQDFTHRRAISENTFLYFNQGWYKATGLSHYGVKCNFKIEATRYYFLPEWSTRSEPAKEFARQHYVNVVSDIEVGLRKLPME